LLTTSAHKLLSRIQGEYKNKKLEKDFKETLTPPNSKSLGLRKNIISDVKVEVTAISTPTLYEDSDIRIKIVGQNFGV